MINGTIYLRLIDVIVISEPTTREQRVMAKQILTDLENQLGSILGKPESKRSRAERAIIKEWDDRIDRRAMQALAVLAKPIRIEAPHKIEKNRPG